MMDPDGPCNYLSFSAKFLCVLLSVSLPLHQLDIKYHNKHINRHQHASSYFPSRSIYFSQIPVTVSTLMGLRCATRTHAQK
jgi:hypothetical protein